MQHRPDYLPDHTPAPGSADPAERKTFQIGRQLQIYLDGARPGRFPVRVEDLEARARKVLAPGAYDWVAGSAGSGDTARANLEAFRRWRLVPRMLRDISARDFGVELFGRRYPAPVLIAPIGIQSVIHPQGEVATGRAAAAVGVPLVVSTVSSCSLEEVAAGMGDGPRWFQLYWPRDPELTLSLLGRAERAGYTALVVTLDTQILGWREGSLELAYLPFLHGHGLGNYLNDPVFQKRLEKDPRRDASATVEQYMGVFSNLAHTWQDLRFLREHTKLPILLKGVQCPDDARRALDFGVDGLIVSNHGGRQVDGGLASLTALVHVHKAVRDRVPLLVDGGVRRGADVLKALALGAKAVLLGRPVMWALGIAGEEGVRQFLLNFLADLDVTFALCGKATLADVSPADVVADQAPPD